MLEYEKYQDLQAKTQKTQEEYERQITELENRKEEEVTRQRMQYTAQLEKLKNDLILVRFHIHPGLRKSMGLRRSMPIRNTVPKFYQLPDLSFRVRARAHRIRVLSDES
jgi:hypothetical protein